VFASFYRVVLAWGVSSSWHRVIRAQALVWQKVGPEYPVILFDAGTPPGLLLLAGRGFALLFVLVSGTQRSWRFRKANAPKAVQVSLGRLCLLCVGVFRLTRRFDVVVLFWNGDVADSISFSCLPGLVSHGYLSTWLWFPSLPTLCRNTAKPWSC